MSSPGKGKDARTVTMMDNKHLFAFFLHVHRSTFIVHCLGCSSFIVRYPSFMVQPGPGFSCFAIPGRNFARSVRRAGKKRTAAARIARLPMVVRIPRL